MIRTVAITAFLLATSVAASPHRLIAQQLHVKRVQQPDSSLAAPDLDSEVTAVFERAYELNPLNEDQLRVIRQSETSVRELDGFSSTVSAGRLAVQHPTNDAYEREFSRRLDALLRKNERQDMLPILYFVIKSSIEEQNEDKRYWLRKLREANKTSEALADYLEQVRAEANPSCESLPCVTTRAELMDEEDLDVLIRRIEADREALGNDRELAASMLQEAMSLSGQYMSILASVLKTMKERHTGVIRNIR